MTALDGTWNVERTGGMRPPMVGVRKRIAAYQLLERVATRAGDEETAEVARLNRAEEEAMARKLDEHWDLFAEQSLRKEGVPV